VLATMEECKLKSQHDFVSIRIADKDRAIEVLKQLRAERLESDSTL